MTDEEQRQRHGTEAIARDRYRVWGDLSDQEYTIAWSRRLVYLLPIAEPRDQWQAQMQAARRVASSAVAAVDAGKPWPDMDPEDEKSFNELLSVVPDIETHVRMLGPSAGSEDSEESITAEPLPPRTAGARLEETAATLDQVTGGRVSAVMFIGVLGLPLGCAFILGFVALILVFGGALALIGLDKSPVANEVGLAAAFIGAVVVVVLVYRKLILRVPWLRRLINR